MNDMTVLVQHYVPVVPVFDLEKITDDTVRGHAHHEVPPGLKLIYG